MAEALTTGRMIPHACNRSLTQVST